MEGNKMSRIWKLVAILSVFVLVLSACGKTTEIRVEEGLQVTAEVFEGKAKKTTDEVEGTQLYKPTGFKVGEDSDAQNIVLNKGKQPFILFINPNEKKDSQLFYDLLHAGENPNLIAEEKFSDDEKFGFVAILQNDDGTVELIANVGSAKITTQTKEKNITEDLEVMMEIVRSIE